MNRLPVAKLTIRLRGTSQEGSKTCIGWHDHVGCYAKKNNNKKFKLDFWEIYEFLEIREFIEIHECIEIHVSFEINESL